MPQSLCPDDCYLEFAAFYGSVLVVWATYELVQRFRTRWSVDRTLRSLPRDAKDECVICLDARAEEESVRLACGHVFHTACVARWLRVSVSCPTCRAGVLEMV